MTKSTTILDNPRFSQLKIIPHYIGKSKMTSGDASMIEIIKDYKYDLDSPKDNPSWFPLHNKSIHERFEYNDNKFNEAQSIDYIYAIYSDMSFVEGLEDFGEFIENIGESITDKASYNRVKAMYDGCKNSARIWHTLFNEEETKLFEEWFSENM